MTAALLWLLAGVLACGAELLLPTGGYLLWIGLAACAAGAATEAAGLAFPGQVAAFVVFLAALLAIPLLRRRTKPLVNAPDDEMLGRTCRAIAFDGAEGRVRVGDGSWPARLTSGATSEAQPASDPAPDAVLQVVGRDGTTLLVQRLSA